MSIHSRKLPALFLTTAITLTLASCAGSATASATPTEVLKAYAADLNAGRISEAFARVADTQGIDPAEVTALPSLAVAEPLLKTEEELPAEVESVSLSYTVGSQDWGVEFVKTDGGWKLAAPAFIAHHVEVEPDPEALTVARLAEMGVPITTASGDDAFATEWIVSGRTGKGIITGTTAFPGDDLFESFEWPFAASISLSGGDLPSVQTSFGTKEPVRLTDEAAAPLLNEVRTWTGRSVASDTEEASYASDEGFCEADAEEVAAHLAGEDAEVTCGGEAVVRTPRGTTYEEVKTWRFSLTPAGEASLVGE